MESVDYERIEGEIKKIRYNLDVTEMEIGKRLLLLNLLRYDLSLIEDRDKVEKVKYNYKTKKLEFSESIEIGIAISLRINEVIREETELSKQQELYKCMQEVYYYLARYLFEYYLPAMEFGIAPEKQFIAPRTSVLNRIAKEMSKFYYRTDRPIMTLSMPQGTGKEQPLSSKILTPEGWITMGEVKVGTKVIGADGKPCNVTGVYPKGIKDVYRVSFDDGSYVDCGLEHLWEVKTSDDRRRKKNARVVNTKQMLNNFILGKNSKRPYHNYSVRLVKPIEYDDKLEQDDLRPYLLGALIGDGGLSRNTVKFTTADEEILERVSQELPENDKICKYSGDNYDYGISNKKLIGNVHTQNQTFLKLQEYGLQGKTSEYKFIPKKYLYSSVKNRIDLLRGLMDTDGWTDKRDCNCCFYTTSKQLAKDVLELIRGLGGKASLTSKIGKYKDKNGNIKECKRIYMLNISININPFYLKRKAKQYSTPQFNYQKMIINIEKVRQEECQCIMVDSPEHLYITDGYTLTHNTEISKRFMSWAIGKNPELPNMMISYSANIAKDKFFNGIDALIKDDMGNYGKIFPKLREIYRSAETMSLDYTNEENRKKAHSEYTLYCVGFDGSITGRTRAHNILYADDLIKDIEEASNKDIMDKKWVEFTGTIKKRMQGRCKMLVVGTIFSINDPLSRLIQYYQENEPERLIVIRIPGLDENDESNFNYKYGFAITTKMFHEDRDLMDPVSFSCLIQQEPIEREGILFYENEFKKFDLSKYEQKEGYVRTVAFCDVAWGGEDYLSMPIVDEYEDGDCKLVDWYFINKADKTITKPAIIQKIQQHKISRMCFEANNGGDEYADDIKRQLKEERVECYVESKKAPTTMSKTDRILNHQAEIRGSRASKYRLVIPERESIKGNKMFNEALNQVFKFNQSTSKNVRKRQHDDAPDSLAGLFANVLGVGGNYGKAISNISREFLGI